MTVFPTGEKISEVGYKLKQAQIYDINSHTISAVIREKGCGPTRSKIIRDNTPAIKNAIAAGMKTDMMGFMGGSSVGEKTFFLKFLKK
ncbi:MAG: hypothetical protein JSV74_00890 [Dehalococcoidia bacterium]|nr:MAG: hypothetical protein JSV74_00890 [Dehalococcoidia bacterium]